MCTRGAPGCWSFGRRARPSEPIVAPEPALPSRQETQAGASPCALSLSRACRRRRAGRRCPRSEGDGQRSRPGQRERVRRVGRPDLEPRRGGLPGVREHAVAPVAPRRRRLHGDPWRGRDADRVRRELRVRGAGNRDPRGGRRASGLQSGRGPREEPDRRSERRTRVGATTSSRPARPQPRSP